MNPKTRFVFTASMDVDPEKEAQRLRENSALGKSPEIGDTPSVQPKKRGFLEGVF